MLSFLVHADDVAALQGIADLDWQALSEAAVVAATKLKGAAGESAKQFTWVQGQLAQANDKISSLQEGAEDHAAVLARLLSEEGTQQLAVAPDDLLNYTHEAYLQEREDRGAGLFQRFLKGVVHDKRFINPGVDAAKDDERKERFRAVATAATYNAAMSNYRWMGAYVMAFIIRCITMSAMAVDFVGALVPGGNQ